MFVLHYYSDEEHFILYELPRTSTASVLFPWPDTPLRYWKKESVSYNIWLVQNVCIFLTSILVFEWFLVVLLWSSQRYYVDPSFPLRSRCARVPAVCLWCDFGLAENVEQQVNSNEYKNPSNRNQSRSSSLSNQYLPQVTRATLTKVTKVNYWMICVRTLGSTAEV